ncbi:MAG: AI-2E family transporter [Mycobacteriales bacterium]
MTTSDSGDRAGIDSAREARELAALVQTHAQPHAEAADPVARQAAAGASRHQPFGQIGRPLSRRSPFRVGFVAALGVALAVGLVSALAAVGGVLTLVLVAGFFAIALDAPVTALAARGMRRSLAVTIVLAGALAVLALFVTIAVPAIAHEYHRLVSTLPTLLRRVQSRHDLLGRAAGNVHLSASTLSKPIGSVGLVDAGRTVLSALTATLTVVVLTGYLLANLPSIKQGAYRLVPRSRRARVGLLTDEILRRVGGYMLGNLITSAAAGGAMFGFLLLAGVPDSAFLGLLVAVFDLIPMIGAPVAGAIIALVALSVSLPIAVATVAFTLVFRVVEDYVLSPRVLRRTVEVAPVVTVVAVIVGGSLLGIVGALVAVPVAAALDLLRQEVLQPQADQA